MHGALGCCWGSPAAHEEQTRLLRSSNVLAKKLSTPVLDALASLAKIIVTHWRTDWQVKWFLKPEFWSKIWFSIWSKFSNLKSNCCSSPDFQACCNTLTLCKSIAAMNIFPSCFVTLPIFVYFPSQIFALLPFQILPFKQKPFNIELLCYTHQC